MAFLYSYWGFCKSLQKGAKHASPKRADHYNEMDSRFYHYYKRMLLTLEAEFADMHMQALWQKQPRYINSTESIICKIENLLN